MVTWFGNRNPRDKLEEARAAYEDFRTGFDPTDQQRKAAACAEALWHLCDWLFQLSDAALRINHAWHSAADFNAWLANQPEWAEIVRCRDLANGNKHPGLTKTSKPVYVETTASAAAGPIEFLPTGSPFRFVFDDGTVLKAIGPGGAPRDDVEPILLEGLDAWDAIFARLGL